MPLIVVTREGKVSLLPSGRPAVAPAGPEAAPCVLGGVRAAVVLVSLLFGTAFAARAFMVVFSASYEAASRALPAGSLASPRRDAAHAPARERARRREALMGYDRQIADAAGDPRTHAARHELDRREVEAVEGVERHLTRIRHSIRATTDPARGPD